MHSTGHDNGLCAAYPPGYATEAARCGLTKREFIAALCLQGILANKSIGRLTLWSTTQSAVMYADQLLECLARDAGDAAELARAAHAVAPLEWVGPQSGPSPMRPRPAETTEGNNGPPR